MEEAKQTNDNEVKEQDKTESTDNSGEGDKPQTTPLIDDANLAAKRMEDATKAMREENDRRERMIAEQKLGGKTLAGEEVKKKETTSVNIHLIGQLSPARSQEIDAEFRIDPNET